MEEITRFVLLAQTERFTLTELCEQFGISRKTGYKHLERYALAGLKGLQPRSHRPHSFPQRTDAAVEALILAERRQHRTWGPKKLHTVLTLKHGIESPPARSTICEILRRHGLSVRRRRTPGAYPTLNDGLTVPTQPNHVWTVDFKGWFNLGNGQRCDPLTVCDRYSRYVLGVRAQPNQQFKGTLRTFKGLMRQAGLPEVIRVDHGSPFASNGLGRLSSLSLWWIEQGIEVEFTRPASPQDNGSHERMHRDLKAEATRPPSANLAAQQRRFERWQHTYNHERPHESLEQQCPAEFYQPRRQAKGSGFGVWGLRRMADRWAWIMARPLRLESEDGVYHVLNRGNYRADLFRAEKTKAAFLKCLDEACGKTGWRVHAWCIMSNHYHLAIRTPRANLVEGMRWLQGTFATRFNRLRDERGHLFQGRYKSLIVDPDGGLGSLCHYIHLNPVRARVCLADSLREQRWSSIAWLIAPQQRPTWYDPQPALAHAGGLADTSAGRKKYLEYLAWLAEDEPARKEQRFAAMSTGWVIGTREFAQALARENRELTGQGRRLAAEGRATAEAVWQEELESLLRKLRRKPEELVAAGKSVDWKLAVAAALKARTTVTNRWLATTMHLGNLHEVSRKVGAWTRQPDPALQKKLHSTPRSGGRGYE